MPHCFITFEVMFGLCSIASPFGIEGHRRHRDTRPDLMLGIVQNLCFVVWRLSALSLQQLATSQQPRLRASVAENLKKLSYIFSFL